MNYHQFYNPTKNEWEETWKKNTSNELSNLMTGQPTLPTHLPQKEGLDKALLRETNGQ